MVFTFFISSPGPLIGVLLLVYLSFVDAVSVVQALLPADMCNIGHMRPGDALSLPLWLSLAGSTDPSAAEPATGITQHLRESHDKTHIPQCIPFGIVVAISQAPWQCYFSAGVVVPFVDWPTAFVYLILSAPSNTAPADSPKTDIENK